MDEMYPTTLSEKEIQHAAEEIILKHGDDAFAEAAKEISASNKSLGVQKRLSGKSRLRAIDEIRC